MGSAFVGPSRPQLLSELLSGGARLGQSARSEAPERQPSPHPRVPEWLMSSGHTVGYWRRLSFAKSSGTRRRQLRSRFSRPCVRTQREGAVLSD